jgi:nitronate monooxygenase
MHTVGSVEEARRAAACGVDIVVAQGWEAGGHVWSGVATLPLVPAVVDAVAPLPVVAAGGIGDARGVAAVLRSARRPPCWAPGSCWPTRCRSTRTIAAA